MLDDAITGRMEENYWARIQGHEINKYRKRKGVCLKEMVEARTGLGPNHVARMAATPPGVTSNQDVLATSDLLVGALQRLQILGPLFNPSRRVVFLQLGTSIHKRKGEPRDTNQAYRVQWEPSSHRNS